MWESWFSEVRAVCGVRMSLLFAPPRNKVDGDSGVGQIAVVVNAQRPRPRPGVAATCPCRLHAANHDFAACHCRSKLIIQKPCCPRSTQTVSTRTSPCMCLLLLLLHASAPLSRWLAFENAPIPDRTHGRYSLSSKVSRGTRPSRHDSLRSSNRPPGLNLNLHALVARRARPYPMSCWGAVVIR